MPDAPANDVHRKLHRSVQVSCRINLYPAQAIPRAAMDGQHDPVTKQVSGWREDRIDPAIEAVEAAHDDSLAAARLKG